MIISFDQSLGERWHKNNFLSIDIRHLVNLNSVLKNKIDNLLVYQRDCYTSQLNNLDLKGSLFPSCRKTEE